MLSLFSIVFCYAPAMTMAGALSVTPVRPSVCTYVRLSNDIRSLSRILIFWILRNFVTLFSTMMSSSRSIMVHITPCFQYRSYGSLFMKIHHLKRCPLSKSNTFEQNFMKLVTLLSTMMSSSSTIMVILHHAFSSYGPLFMKIHRLKWCQLSKSNIFDQNFMKLGHIV